MNVRKKLEQLRDRMRQGRDRQRAVADRMRAHLMRIRAASSPLPDDYDNNLEPIQDSATLVGDAIISSFGRGDDANLATGRLTAYLARKAMRDGEDPDA